MLIGKYRLALMLVSLFFLGGAYALSGQYGNTQKVIKITVKMFEYEPAIIELKKGEKVIIELASLDRMHGFNIPELGLRADLLPGQTAKVEVLPDKVGRYDFLCDIFCGGGHDEMNGVIIVTD